MSNSTACSDLRAESELALCETCPVSKSDANKTRSFHAHSSERAVWAAVLTVLHSGSETTRTAHSGKRITWCDTGATGRSYSVQSHCSPLDLLFNHFWTRVLKFGPPCKNARRTHRRCPCVASCCPASQTNTFLRLKSLRRRGFQPHVTPDTLWRYFT